MSWIEINKDRCKGCLLCTDVCPKDLIHQSTHINDFGYKIAGFIENGKDLCIGCSACAVICPDIAISVFRTRKVKE